MPVSMNNTQVVFNDATVQTTAGYPNTNPSGFTSNTGTVTSVATGNGLQGGTITTSGTLSVACPTYNTVGSYSMGGMELATGLGVTGGSNYAVGSGNGQMRSWAGQSSGDSNRNYLGLNISGTWKWMGATTVMNDGGIIYAVICRVS